MVNYNQIAAVRLELGHGQGNRIVQVRDDGEVIYFGSTDEFDYTNDFWHSGGHITRLVREIEEGTGTPR